MAAAPSSPRAGATAKTPKGRTSILGASRKAVSSAVRKPLRAVGRAVSRREGSRGRQLSDAEDLIDAGNPDAANGYGSLVEVESGDDQIPNRRNSKQASRRRSSARTAADINRERYEAEWAIYSMEGLTRTVVFMCLAYVIGAKRPEWITQVTILSEYAVTAWVTCLLTLGLAQFHRNHPEWVPFMTPRPPREEDMRLLSRNDRELVSSSAISEEPQEVIPVIPVLRAPPPTPRAPILETQSTLSPETDTPVVTAVPDTPFAHPALAPFFIVDADTNERIYPNSETPTHISNEWFELDMLVLLRTPDVDDSMAKKGLPYNSKWVEYLKPKQRRFEFQYQMKLKKIPKNKAFYFSCEVEEPIKMGVVQRALVGAAMAFMKSANPTFHYSITGSKDRPEDGRYEKPHMSFTVEYSLDRLVVTKPGEKPPELGNAIVEDPEALKQRKKGAPVDWNLEDTYTMALWSAYVDFIDWKVLNLPGIRPFGLAPILGNQAFCMSMYLIEEKRDNDKHYQKDITNVIRLELSNDRHAEKGPSAHQWSVDQAAKKKLAKAERAISVDTSDTVDTADNLDGCMEPNEIFIKSNEEEPEDEEEAETAAKLGEGIYVRSGDSICLREFTDSGDDDGAKITCVSNGGGFAVLQDQEVQVVIEKTRRAKKSRLIKHGDTVMFKMIQKKRDGTEARYLTIHRGWWLKWVLTVPSKNGFFTIYTQDLEGDKPDHLSTDTQSSYLTMGGTFTLRHKRWSSFFVGIAGEPSATYGGRMLGLYNPKRADNVAMEEYQSEEGEPDDGFPDFKGGKPSWMRPLTFMAFEPPSLAIPSLPLTPSAKRERSIETEEAPVDNAAIYFNPRVLLFSAEHSHCDVPAWIETMNRTDRVRQLTYVVRVSSRQKEERKIESETPETPKASEQTPETFVRLRTGRELAQVMRIGQSVRYSLPGEESGKKKTERRGGGVTGLSRTTPSVRQISVGESVGTAMTPSSHGRLETAILSLSPNNERLSSHEIGNDFSFETAAKDEESEDESVVSIEEDDNNYESDDQLPAGFEEVEGDEAVEVELESEQEHEEPETDYSETEGEPEIGPVEKKKKGVKALLGKSVKATAGGVVKTTKLTGKVAAKAVVGAGKLTGKAAVGTTKVAKKAVNVGKTAGRAVIAPVSRKAKKPPKAEPKTKGKEKDHVAVPKSLKKMTRREKKSGGSPSFLAGELCAPEQSRQTASRVLSRMSSVPFRSTHWKRFNAALTSQLEIQADQDRRFLEGTSVDLGVVPNVGDKSRGKLVTESVVARCLWESHWREEWCGVYETCLSFYSPLSKVPCYDIAFIDVLGVRPLDVGDSSPLPGFPLLVLETAWLCHYIAFHDEEARDTFGEKVDLAIEVHIKQIEAKASLQEEDLRKARFWQGFQSLSESSLSSGTGKWAKIPSKEKLKERVVLNGRRMAFDNKIGGFDETSTGFKFVEGLLERALSFSLDSLEKSPAAFVEFLDLTGQLRVLALDEVDLSSKRAFCLFANLYHCLLQHALLLSVNGPLQKRSYGHFMRTACYEIGPDVFSLAELYCCVLRGKLSKPVNPKPPYIEAPKKSHPYRVYALDYRDPRINFVLNTGDYACPQDIPVLRKSTLEQQLHRAAYKVLSKEMGVDRKKRTVLLPKVCEVYKHDFGGDCLKYCIPYMDEDTGCIVRIMMAEVHSIILKYQPTSDQFHTYLKMDTLPQQHEEAITSKASI
eukprot:Nitzschia sp. Nitz4//scaffold143_size57137//47798//52921//NITZ4_006522-RA/size57137-processed-gene-0.41-mRNA-1//1//CDS//3329536470//5924//frame0